MSTASINFSFRVWNKF